MNDDFGWFAPPTYYLPYPPYATSNNLLHSPLTSLNHQTTHKHVQHHLSSWATTQTKVDVVAEEARKNQSLSWLR